MAWDYTNDYSSTILAYTSGAGSITIVSVTGLPASGLNFILKVDDEYFLCTSYTGLVLTVVGGQAGSTPANHSLGAAITGCWIVPSVLDGIRSDANQIGTYASKPSSGMKKGDRYKCTDSPYEYVYDGSVWQAFAFGYNVVEPVLANFTQVNMGSSTTDITHGGIIHSSPSNGSASNTHFLAQAIPSSGAYYVDAACLSLSYAPYGAGNGGGNGCGLASLATSSAAIAAHSFAFESNLIWVWERQLMNSATSFNSNAGEIQVVPVGPLLWTRIYDDGTTYRTFYISFNGYTWLQVYQESRTNLFTPAYAILGMQPYACIISTHWLHFSIHT